MFANLTQQAILRAQVNSLQACYPRIRIEVKSKNSMPGNTSSLPNNARVFEDAPGYGLLPRCEELLKSDEFAPLLRLD